MPTINVAVLPAVIIVVRLGRRTQARSRNDEKPTVLIVLALSWRSEWSSPRPRSDRAYWTG
ncbi:MULTISPECIES: hypothetical protein [unclassified Streptomyces]|uniref:hypothetical protein n=1 Tax=unclassified Streptomyces TaxID=2593676 RepID=UPI002E0D18AD